MSDPQNKPNYECAAHKMMAPAIKIVRDVAGGTTTMRRAGKTYLPSEVAERDDAYNRRLSRSTLFNAYLRTRGGLVGMVFKKDPEIADDVPDQIKTDLENIDLAGTHIDVFAKQLFEASFEGHSFVLVDMEKALAPADGEPTPTLADEQEAGLRPYWQIYKCDQAVNWRTARINGEEKITQITFHETTSEPDGEYGDKDVEKYRVFRVVNGIVSWELWRFYKEKPEQFELLDSGTINGFDEIPVAITYGRKLGLCCSEPPMLDLAYLNISHYQNYSDYRNILHVAQVPILHRAGATTEQAKVEIGVGMTVDTPENGKLEWVEVEGKGIEASRAELVDLEQRMAVMGLSILSQRSDSVITATEKRQDYQERQSDLATMARSLKDCLEQALDFHAQYLGLDLVANDGGSIELGVEEMNLTLTPQHFATLLQAVVAGKLSLDTFLGVTLNLLADTGLLAEDVTVDDEVAKIKAATAVQQAVGLPGLAAKGTLNAPPGVKNLLGAGNPVQ